MPLFRIGCLTVVKYGSCTSCYGDAVMVTCDAKWYISYIKTQSTSIYKKSKHSRTGVDLRHLDVMDSLSHLSIYMYINLD